MSPTPPARRPPDAPGHLPEWLVPFRDVRAYLFEGECIDIGTPQTYREVCERFENLTPRKG